MTLEYAYNHIRNRTRYKLLVDTMQSIILFTNYGNFDLDKTFNWVRRVILAAKWKNNRRTIDKQITAVEILKEDCQALGTIIAKAYSTEEAFGYPIIPPKCCRPRRISETVWQGLPSKSVDWRSKCLAAMCPKECFLDYWWNGCCQST